MFKNASPGTVGLALSHWRNVQSAVRRAVRPCDLADASTLADVPLTEGWVDDELWQAVKVRQEAIARQAAEKGLTGNRLNGTHRRQFLLSGLLTCGLCAGAYTICGKDRYACANHTNRGTCDNARTVKRQAIEARVLAGLKDRLLSPELIEVFIAEYLAELNRQNRDGEQAWTASRRELADIDGRINALIDAIERGIVTDSTKERLLALEARKQALESMSPPEQVPRLHPGIAKTYRAQVERLEEALNDPGIRREAGEVLRSLIGKIVLTPGAARGEVDAELHGQLGAILALAEAGIKNRTPGCLGASGVRLSVVAGARNRLVLLFQATGITVEKTRRNSKGYAAQMPVPS